MPSAAPIRLAYLLAFLPHSQRVRLVPRPLDREEPLSEAEVRAMRTGLHPLDAAIVQEILATTVYGQLGDAQLARLLPVLAQRRTRLGDQRLDLHDTEELQPRVRCEVHGRSLSVTLTLARKDPEKAPWEADSGRLLLGDSAFFLRGAHAWPIKTRSPRALLPFAKDPTLMLGPDRLTSDARDQFVADLTSAGVPEEDFEALRVHRGPPSRIVVRFVDSQLDGEEPHVSCQLEAHYEQGAVLLGQGGPQGLLVHEPSPAPDAAAEEQPAAEAPAEEGGAPEGEAEAEAEAAIEPKAEAQDPAAPAQEQATEAAAPEGDAALPELIDEEEDPLVPPAERDQEAEADALRAMRLLGFRSERGHSMFTASGELALRALDARFGLFDTNWHVERGNFAPKFHRDLALSTHAKLLEDQGLIDLSVEVLSVGDDPSQSATVDALIKMQALLGWLQSGQRYLRLADGSFAAPSARFRQGLKILGDLGADSSRALISPLCVGLLRAIGDVAALATVDEATRKLMDELLKAGAPRSVPVPEGLNITLRDYQARGLDWLMLLHRHRLTGILADDMGLGKTLQTLALLLAVKDEEGTKPSLVVAPTSVVTVWRDEAERFAPGLKVALWYGSPQERAQLDVKKADLVVTSYGVLRRDAERLGELSFRYVILDEAQSTKNARSLGAHAIRRLKSERRLALSGTPLENRPEELWSVFDFLAPGFLGSLRKFRRTYALPIARGDQDAMALLRLKIEPLVLRRLKKEVARELPDKIESTLRCEMEPAQRALYDHVAGELKESIKEKIAQLGIEQAQLDILAALTRLRQICCDPALLPAPAGTKVPPSAKLALFEELMREALDSERCVVVFSQFVQMQRRLISVIKKLGVDPLWLHGGTTHRDKVVAAFQDPKGPPVIVVSLKAGGTGLTLTRADTVMHYDPWWNPAVERQATDRTHRLGQTQTVTVYRLVCARSIEERVLKMAESKEALAASLLGSEGGPASKRISREEIMALLS